MAAQAAEEAVTARMLRARPSLGDPNLPVQPPNWDAWRAAYDRFGHDGQRAFYAEVARQFPDQSRFSWQQVEVFLDRYRPDTVVELGGWDGELAAVAIAQRPGLRWTNYDLVSLEQRCSAPGYEFVLLEQPFWERRRAADAFVASHVIEHLRMAELGLIVASLDVGACYVEAPLQPGPSDWAGYCGTHIIEQGWDGIDALFAGYGFQAERCFGHGRFYARR